MTTRPILLVCLTIVCGCASERARHSPAPHHVPAQGALGPYSAAVRTSDLVFVSGKIGKPGANFVTEAESAIDAVSDELARQSLTLADVVSATVYLTDMKSYAELNEVYARKVPQPYPARACVAVSALPGGARVEIQVVARARR